jgi:hypothetical protein
VLPQELVVLNQLRLERKTLRKFPPMVPRILVTEGSGQTLLPSLKEVRLDVLGKISPVALVMVLGVRPMMFLRESLMIFLLNHLLIALVSLATISQQYIVMTSLLELGD